MDGFASFCRYWKRFVVAFVTEAVWVRDNVFVALLIIFIGLAIQVAMYRLPINEAAVQTKVAFVSYGIMFAIWLVWALATTAWRMDEEIHSRAGIPLEIRAGFIGERLSLEVINHGPEAEVGALIDLVDGVTSAECFHKSARWRFLGTSVSATMATGQRRDIDVLDVKNSEREEHHPTVVVLLADSDCNLSARHYGTIFEPIRIMMTFSSGQSSLVLMYVVHLDGTTQHLRRHVYLDPTRHYAVSLL